MGLKKTGTVDNLWVVLDIEGLLTPVFIPATASRPSVSSRSGKVSDTLIG
jgi:hypothetical protein